MEPKDWITLGLGFLTFSGVALNLGFNVYNRSSTHRDFLYRKQVEEYEKFIRLLPKANYPLLEKSTKEHITDEELQECFDLQEELDSAAQLVLLYAPDEVMNGIDDYVNSVNKILRSLINDRKLTRNELWEAYHGILIRERRLIRIIRASLGFERLSEEILQTTRMKRGDIPDSIDLEEQLKRESAKVMQKGDSS